MYVLYVKCSLHETFQLQQVSFVIFENEIQN